MMVFDCPRGCEWQLAIALCFNKFALPHDGVACPRHQLYCKRRKA